jgi:hypothetical protein
MSSPLYSHIIDMLIAGYINDPRLFHSIQPAGMALIIILKYTLVMDCMARGTEVFQRYRGKPARFNLTADAVPLNLTFLVFSHHHTFPIAVL